MVFASRSPAPTDDAYADIFSRRGDAYNLGMRKYPHARSDEFQTAIAALDPTPGMTLLDAPAGGGYLQRFLAPETRTALIEVDPAAEFRPEAPGALKRFVTPGGTLALIAPLNGIPVGDRVCDGIVSVAGLHHASNLGEIFTEFRRILRPGGRLVIMEVDSGGCVDRFLNGFVDQHNSMGHHGDFVGAAFRRRLMESGFTIERDSLERYTWHFENRDAMVEFTQLLFGLDRADSHATLEGIGDILGFAEHPTGCAMNWELRLLAAS